MVMSNPQGGWPSSETIHGETVEFYILICYGVQLRFVQYKMWIFVIKLQLHLLLVFSGGGDRIVGLHSACVWSCVCTIIILVVEDLCFLSTAESTSTRFRTIGSGSSNDFPLDGLGNVAPLEIPKVR